MKIPFSQTTITICITLALSACATSIHHSDFTLDATGEIMSTQETEQSYDINGEWWQIYQNPYLNQLIEQALANNIDLKQAAINVNKALYQANILGADLVPSFNSSLGANVRTNLETGSSTRNYSSELGLSYEIDLWQKLRLKSSAQIWEYQASQQDLASTRLTLINNIADAYFNIAYLNESIELTEKSIQQYQEIQRIARAKYRLGKTDSSETIQAEQSLISARNQLINLQISLENQQQTLRNLLNLKPNQELAIAPKHFQLNQPIGVDLNVPITVLANRPDLRASEYRLQSALNSLDAQKRSWYPSISLGASLGSSSNKPATMFDVPMLGGTVSINLPFLDWQTLKWNTKISEANLESAKLNFEQTLLTALNEVNTHYIQYRHATQTLANQQRRYQLDQKNSRYYQVRYRHGKNELKDWLTALNSEYSSAQNLLNQRYETLKYENMIYKAMAGRYTPK